MNILFLANHLNTGGITSYITNLSTGLKKRGHNLFIASSGGELFGTLKDAGIFCWYVPMNTKNEFSLKIARSAFRLSKRIKSNHIDIVHSNSRTTQVLGCILKRFNNVRHIFTCHGFFKRRLSRRIFPCWSDEVIAISAQVQEHLINDFRLSKERISLICNGIDTERFTPVSFNNKKEAKISLGLSSNPVIGILARLSDVKGHKYLIEAMKEVLLVYPNAQLLIAGEGRMEIGLKRLARDLNINRSVHFVSNAIDTRKIISALDLFVLPSLQEGLGLALMEAMSMGLAVVGSAVGGIKTLIQDRHNGLLVRPGDSLAIAQAITSLISDPDLALNLGENARKYIIKEFSLEKMILGTERVYQSCYE